MTGVFGAVNIEGFLTGSGVMGALVISGGGTEAFVDFGSSAVKGVEGATGFASGLIVAGAGVANGVGASAGLEKVGVISLAEGRDAFFARVVFWFFFFTGEWVAGLTAAVELTGISGATAGAMEIDGGKGAAGLIAGMIFSEAIGVAAV